MKKLMIAAAIVCAAVCANAYTMKWGTSYAIGDGTESGVTSATTVYLISSAVTASSIYDDMVNNGKTFEQAISGKTLDSNSLSGGETSLKQNDSLPSGSLTAYLACFDSDLNAVYFSEQLTKSVPETGFTTMKFDNNNSILPVATSMTGFSAKDGGWVAVTPEPTSGLLLLIGMAGLALRRRRA